MEINKEREERAAFDKEFGVSEINMFASNDENLNQSLVLKCNWLGWKKRAELEYRNNPETIEVSGLDTIKKLCKFADKHDMAGCTFTEIVERMFDELNENQKVKTKTTKRKCGSCGGFCGGRKGSCKFAANELKKETARLWSLAVAGHKRG